MQNRRKRQLADVPAGRASPLDTAVSRRDSGVMETVRAAVQNNQAMLAFQPIMHARDPGVVAYYEGFIRVLDATGRVVPAGAFMGQAEQTELGREIDCAALQMGLKVLRRYRDVRLAINMSARSIGYRKWLRILDRVLKDDPALGERLILEISEESAMMVPEIVVDFMAQMQSRGISFALDDYGSGEIAIRRFRDFLFDAVKIDGQFVRGLQQNPQNQMLVSALVRVAHEFDMFTVAESVETRGEAEMLASLGADCLQGYLFGAPSVEPPWLPDARDVVPA